MKYSRIYTIVLLCLCAITTATATPVVKTGIDILIEQDFAPLQGKRVGLITNPTGIDSQVRSTIDILHETPNVNLVALYAPEHGVRGNIYAGDKVNSSKDSKTGLPVHSLYGKSRKPTADMLRGIDVLVYDIQDIGCRSYTFISTMGLAMQAAAEQGIEFMVLDRPNPLGGYRVEGCPVEEGFTSFVSQYPIPYIYGLTCGELAQLLNGEGMIGDKKCQLTVIAMQGWKRDMDFEATGLPWVLPSPHIPEPLSAYYYPLSGIAGELGTISIGVGYTKPFQLFGASWIDANKLADRLNALNLPGLSFRPIHYTPFYGNDKGTRLQGVQVHITNRNLAALSEVQFYVIQELASLYPGHDLFANAEQSRLNMIDKVCGTSQIRKQFTKRYRWEDARDYWHKGVGAFKQLSRQYYIYP
ncbi:MAG: DUF1343 domain-containing protein [Bacteroidaceae bacterium]|nr:DUF1343 domain-containing protein [Bacteroidales bacterium]MBP3671856.1 DUF1343 domain-containing protein [Bacteroidaceae bacterium]MBQ2979399.1 DUF1343 domain-containing protein [Bacteroidaceae bacterium]